MRTFCQRKVLQGDSQLAEGVMLILLPGHTLGLQGVLVQSETGSYLIVSDAVGVYENWTGNEAMAHIPQGIHWSLEDYFETFSKMEEINAHVLPAHDFRVRDRHMCMVE
jgi:glyoxylase-like metal-dependent hydrolase (beta-lactamase superfamily II)